MKYQPNLYSSYLKAIVHV